MTYKSLIGNTPLYLLENYIKKYNIPAAIYAKLEFFNPTGSIKDRTALAMIEQAEADGILKAGMTIVEPTSGNTGVALAAISAAKGYRAVLVMPESMSAERRKLISAYGAEIVLTDAKAGMRGAVEKAREIVLNLRAFMPDQFNNPANPRAHKATGREIWEQSGGIDLFVAGVGTGGTITGAGEFLKTKNPNIKIIAVEPDGSPVLSQGRAGRHKIQGIGAGFVPDVLNTDVYNEVVTVTDEAAMQECKNIAVTEGLLVGVSSGAALAAAAEVAARPQNSGKKICVIFPDSGDRYLSVM